MLIATPCDLRSVCTRTILHQWRLCGFRWSWVLTEVFCWGELRRWPMCFLYLTDKGDHLPLLAITSNLSNFHYWTGTIHYQNCFTTRSNIVFFRQPVDQSTSTVSLQQSILHPRKCSERLLGFLAEARQVSQQHRTHAVTFCPKAGSVLAVLSLTRKKLEQ